MITQQSLDYYVEKLQKLYPTKYPIYARVDFLKDNYGRSVGKTVKLGRQKYHLLLINKYINYPSLIDRVLYEYAKFISNDFNYGNKWGTTYAKLWRGE